MQKNVVSFCSFFSFYLFFILSVFTGEVNVLTSITGLFDFKRFKTYSRGFMRIWWNFKLHYQPAWCG